jgi:transposase
MDREEKVVGCGRGRGRGVRHAFEVKRRAVKLCVEDGYPTEQVAAELGVGHSTLNTWAKKYREEGENGLLFREGRRGRSQASEAAKQKAVELKRQNPSFGTKRISQLLRRWFFLKAGPETVRQTLQEEKPMDRRCS